uniref:WD repeat-containing protein 37 n=1 Tax=Romanomermis culicivorax TaxID=13658 RepID=A0A915J127_ROMCU
MESTYTDRGDKNAADFYQDDADDDEENNFYEQNDNYKRICKKLSELFYSLNRRRLYELFLLIEKEFEQLHAENVSLHAKIEALSEKIAEGDALLPDKATEIIDLINTDTSTPKSISGKKTSHVGQKLKTAFRVPPGRNLVSSFKAGVTGDASRARFVRVYDGHRDGVWHVDVSKPGSYKAVLGSASADQTARIWNIETGVCLMQYTGHCGSVNSLAFNRTENVLAGTTGLLAVTASGDQSAHVWKVLLPAKSSPSTNLASKSGTAVPSSEDELDVLSEKEDANADGDSDHFQTVRSPLIKLTGHTDVVIAADWLMGGNQAITNFQIITASWDRYSYIYDAERGEIINTLTGHDQELTYCSAHSNQKLVVTSSRDTTFRLWDFRESIHSVAVFQGHSESVTSAVFSSSDKIISGSDDRTLKIWDLRNMRSALTTIRTDSPVNRLAVSQLYNIIAIPHDNRHVRLYDLNGQRFARLPRSNRRSHKRLVSCVAWCDNNAYANLFSCGFDKSLLGWKVSINKE